MKTHEESHLMRYKREYKTRKKENNSSCLLSNRRSNCIQRIFTNAKTTTGNKEK